MSVRFATSDEIDRWNDLILAQPDGGNIFSSYEYAQQKKHGDETYQGANAAGYYHE